MTYLTANNKGSDDELFPCFRLRWEWSVFLSGP